MEYYEFSLKMATDYSDGDIKYAIEKELKLKNIRLSDDEFSFQILHKSLDARKKNDIHWLVRVGVRFEEDVKLNNYINGTQDCYTQKNDFSDVFSLNIEYRRRSHKVVVIGSGPAGFFAGYVLQKAGFNTTIIERGSEVKKREASIKEFESTGKFNPITNYAFGEGGAGTFSDGKLTSRSKHISKERQFVLSSYVQAGAPKEILYMAHPHLGSDHLKQIVKNLRRDFLNKGGTILFETMVKDLNVNNGKVDGVIISSAYSDNKIDSSKQIDNQLDFDNQNELHNEIQADEIIIASGHSSYETFRMLMSKGVLFKAKNFALGCRVEHSQEVINIAQWGRNTLPGVKAAEYRLTSKGDGRLPVYTFCMCPGGVIVPSTAYENGNIVNGMSRFKRNGKFANAACVASVNPEQLISGKFGTQDSKKNRESELFSGKGRVESQLRTDEKSSLKNCSNANENAAKMVDWLENLEHDFYRYSNGYAAPFCSIKSFIDKKISAKNLGSTNTIETSYPLGLKLAPLWELLPIDVGSALREGLKDFCRKIRGFDTGLIMGLESKTSSPVSVLREKNLCCTGFDNLYVVGEGSGHSGGIISSASDGIKAALSIIAKFD